MDYKILHIFSGYGGGISSVILNLTENKKPNFIFDTMTFCYKGGEAFCTRLEACGTTCFTMPRPRIEGVRKFYDFLDSFFSKHSYNAVHCHISGWMAIPFHKYAKKNGIKHFFIHAHTTTYDSRLDRLSLVRAIDQKIDYIIADCYFTCSDLAANYIFGKKYLEKKKTVFVPNGINDNLFKKAITKDKISQYRSEFGILDGNLVIGHVGRFSPPKNHDEVLNIAKQLKVKSINYVLLLIGDGERFEEIKKKSHVLDIDDNLRFVGRRQDIAELMQFFDLMILPSFYEGLPTVAVECQASGIHIFMSDTITQQCDMGLGLTTFLPLNRTTEWVDAICEYKIEKKEPADCVKHINKIGFTATTAGENYCIELERVICE